MNMRKPKVHNPRYSNDDHQYKFIFRFEEKHVNFIVENRFVENGENRGGTLATEFRLDAHRRYGTDPEFQIGSCEDFRMSKNRKVFFTQNNSSPFRGM